MYRVSASDPSWSAEDFSTALEKGVATFAKAAIPAITTQTQWTAFIAGLTSAQTTATMKQILTVVTCGTP
jgi:hypothetical protein